MPTGIAAASVSKNLNLSTKSATVGRWKLMGSKSKIRIVDGTLLTLVNTCQMQENCEQPWQKCPSV